MKHIEKSILVKAPLSLAYEQWTQFEAFPLFMPDILHVRELDDETVIWRVELWGQQLEWESKICDLIPNSFIAWRSTAGAEHSGAVTFDALDRDTTKVTIILDYQPHGFMEFAGHSLGAVDYGIKNALSSFSRFTEARSNPTGRRGRTYENLDMNPTFHSSLIG